MISEKSALPFDQFQRYGHLTDCLSGLGVAGEGARPSLLDVGGYPGVILDFLPDATITVLDNKQSDQSNYVKGDACSMPFDDEEFQIVTAMDVFEHISPERRLAFLTEVTRVARDYVIIGGPFADNEVELAEKVVFEFCLRVLGDGYVESHPLKEHIENGLPEASVVTGFFDEQGLVYRSYPSGNLYNWTLMNLAKNFLFTIPDSDRLQGLFDQFYNEHLSENDVGPPAYRTFFVVSKSGEKPPDAVGRWSKQTKGTNHVADQLQLVQLFFTFFELEAKRELKAQKEYSLGLEKQLHEMEKRQRSVEAEANSKIGELEVEVSRNRAHVSDLERHADNLETSLNRIKRTIFYRLYKTLRRS